MVKRVLILVILFILGANAIKLVIATDPLDPDDRFLDTDNDGLLNYEEYLNKTDPNNSDSDNDGIPDGWEVWTGTNPSDPTDGHKDMDYTIPSSGYNGEIDSSFSAIGNSYDVWPSDGITKFNADLHYDNYEEYYRLSEWKPNEITGVLEKVEIYVASTESGLSDTDGDSILDPDDWAPTIYNNDGTVYFKINQPSEEFKKEKPKDIMDSENKFNMEIKESIEKANELDSYLIHRNYFP